MIIVTNLFLECSATLNITINTLKITVSFFNQQKCNPWQIAGGMGGGKNTMLLENNQLWDCNNNSTSHSAASTHPFYVPISAHLVVVYSLLRHPAKVRSH